MEVAIAIFIAVYLVEKGLHELELRRHAKRESDLLGEIRTLHNRIHAKDVTSYAEMEILDRARKHPPKPTEKVPADNGRYFEGNAPYEDPDNP